MQTVAEIKKPINNLNIHIDVDNTHVENNVIKHTYIENKTMLCGLQITIIAMHRQCIQLIKLKSIVST